MSLLAGPQSAFSCSRRARRAARSATHSGIQVGAFIKFAQAQNAADDAANQIQNLIRAVAVDIQVVIAKGRTLYRARLTGMSQERARESCGHLHAVGQDCALVTPSGAMRMASLVLR